MIKKCILFLLIAVAIVSCKTTENLTITTPPATVDDSPSKRHYDSLQIAQMQQRIDVLEVTINRLREDSSNMAITIEEMKRDKDSGVAKNKMTEAFWNNYSKLDSTYFPYAVMVAPLYYKYNSDRVEFSLELAKKLGYDHPKSEGNEYYEKYKVLLERYEYYYREWLAIIDKTIEEIEFYEDIAQKGEVKNYLKSLIKSSDYYKENEEKKDKRDRIYYIDIKEAYIESLFDDKKLTIKEVLENLKKQRKLIEP